MAYICNYSPTFLNNLSIPVFKNLAVHPHWNASAFNKGPIGCPETSVNNYQFTPCNIPEWRKSHLQTRVDVCNDACSNYIYFVTLFVRFDIRLHCLKCLNVVKDTAIAIQASAGRRSGNFNSVQSVLKSCPCLYNVMQSRRSSGRILLRLKCGCRRRRVITMTPTMSYPYEYM